MILDIHLGKNADITLTYELYDNNVCRLFYDTFKNRPNEIVSRTQFYNFGESADEIQQELDTIVNKLIAAGLISEGNPDNLNFLHDNFARLHKDADGDLKITLRTFNHLIHQLEGHIRNPNPRFIFACDGDPGQPLPEEAYPMFTITKRYGELYMNYPHVGKHFFEMFVDNDVDVPADQIQLTHLMSCGLYAWFGEEKFTNTDRMFTIMEMFYKQVEHKMPYEWGDPKLAIGFLPLGKLQNSDIDPNLIAKHKYVHSWSCR